MKVCIYGCGSIGGLIAARLANTGVDLSVIARGVQLDAIRKNGLRLLEPNSADGFSVRLTATDNPAELGAQDAVFLTMKSHAVSAIAEKIQPLLQPETCVVSASNGIPWWYFFGLPDSYGSPEMLNVDPGRKLWEQIGPQRAIGCVVYPAAKIESPGVVRHIFGDRFTLGEPDGSASARVADLAKMLRMGGFDASVSEDIRAEIWTKLLANAAFNPMSVITGKTLGEMIDDSGCRSMLEKIMQEVITIAHALGVSVAMTATQLLDATRQLGQHKTSMLQDFEAGRQLELSPIVGAVLEMAQYLKLDVPNLAQVSAKAGKIAVLSNKEV